MNTLSETTDESGRRDRQASLPLPRHHISHEALCRAEFTEEISRSITEKSNHVLSDLHLTGGAGPRHDK
jgi:hypothetical protein